VKKVQSNKIKENLSRWNVHVTLESRRLKLGVSWIRRVVHEALRHIEPELPGAEIDELHLLITDDERMRVINRDFRGKDKPTDVLSFPQFSKKELERGRVRGALPKGVVGSYLGDLVIASETTQRQAARFDVSVEEEFIRLVVHGLLHLCGYDHEDVPRAEAERMRRKERRIRKGLVELTPLI
jgi:probable rRNA maturation factor